MSCEHDFNQADRNCPICFPSARYKVHSDIYDRKPIAEILRNGKSWSSPWDQHFRFGVPKAEMILYYIKEIEQFALSKSPAEVYKTPICKTFLSNPSKEIYLQTFPYFLKDDGEIVPMPYLRLDLVVNFIPVTHKGFGQTKARALVILMEELTDWFQSVDHMYA